MAHVAILDLISFLAFLATLAFIIKGRHRPFPPDAKLLFLMLVSFSLLYIVCLFLQWSGVTKVLDPVEDVIGALIPMVWLFFFYAFFQGVLTRDLHQSEASLQESERKLSTLMGNLPGMVYRCIDYRSWTMEFVSKGCKELTGYTPVELSQNGAVCFGDFIHAEDRDMVQKQMQKALSTNRPFQLRYRILSAFDEEKWVWEQGVGIYADTGEFQATEGFITDITQQKQAEAVIQKARDDLEDKVKIRTAEITEAYQKLENAYQKIKNDQGKIIRLERHAIAARVTSTLAHETRNAISIIGGHARILKRKHGSAPEMAHQFDIILEEAGKLELLIAAILKAGHEASAHFENLDTQEILDELYRLTQEKAHLSKITLSKGKQYASASLFADKESVIAALKELVFNAIEASPKKEVVTLEIIQEDKRVVISVTDRGPGISGKNLARIYDPFFSTKKLSSGLGLSFAKELIEAQNGYIRFHTEPGKGTTFYAYFPAGT